MCFTLYIILATNPASICLNQLHNRLTDSRPIRFLTPCALDHFLNLESYYLILIVNPLKDV